MSFDNAAVQSFGYRGEFPHGAEKARPSPGDRKSRHAPEKRCRTRRRASPAVVLADPAARAVRIAAEFPFHEVFSPPPRMTMRESMLPGVVDLTGPQARASRPASSGIRYVPVARAPALQPRLSRSGIHATCFFNAFPASCPHRDRRGPGVIIPASEASVRADPAAAMTASIGHAGELELHTGELDDVPFLQYASFGGDVHPIDYRGMFALDMPQ